MALSLCFVVLTLPGKQKPLLLAVLYLLLTQAPDTLPKYSHVNLALRNHGVQSILKWVLSNKVIMAVQLATLF